MDLGDAAGVSGVRGVKFEGHRGEGQVGVGVCAGDLRNGGLIIKTGIFARL